MRTGPESVLRFIAFAMGAGIVAMAGLELQRTLEDEVADKPAVVAADPLRQTLQRCRTLTPEDLEADTECQAAWAENRRRFFNTPIDDQGTE